MKTILFAKRFVSDTLKILFIIINLMNCVLLHFSTATQLTHETGSDYSSVQQAVYFIPEIIDSKINLKVLTIPYAEKFYSFDFYLKKPGNLLKLFTIISETDSESNTRNFAFLISEFTTGT